MQNHEDKLVWCPLFSITEDEKTAFLDKIKDGKIGNGNLSSFIFDTMYKQGYDYADKDTLEATRRAILNWLIFKTDFALDTLSTKNYENARECYNNCQYDSDILDTLIKYFTLAWGSLMDKNGKPLFFDGKRIFEIIKGDVDNELKKIKNQYAQDKYAHLKAVIDTVCTVNYECYLNSENDKTELENDLNRYIIDTYSYDFIKATIQTEYTCSEYFKNKVNEKLQLSLLNDLEFWQDKEFSVTSFLNHICKNSIENAKSIIDYIFQNLQKDSDTALLIKNGLSIGFSLEILKKKAKEYAIFNSLNEKICYPLFDCENEIINKGKEIFEGFFFDFLYPHCKEKIKDHLSQITNNAELDDVLGAINDATIGNYLVGLERKALYILKNEYFSHDFILKRAYIKSYYLKKLSTQGKENSSLLECFYNVTRILNRELNIYTSIQLDSKLREEKFNLLKDILSKIDVSIDYSADYIASIIDIKSATDDEASRFPILQDLGSKIYDFALAELFFYNPYYSMVEYEFDKYSDYKSKIEIAKFFNLNEDYICHALKPIKFYYDTLNGVIDITKLNDLGRKEKYLADTLDMILGAYCLDKGHNEAIILAKTLIIHTFSDEFTNNDNLLCLGESRKEYIKSHLEILNLMDNKYDYFNIMHRSLYNLLGSLVFNISVDNEKSLALYSPDRIAPLFGDTRFFTEITPPFKCYLENGIDGVISEYGKIALKKYNSK